MTSSGASQQSGRIAFQPGLEGLRGLLVLVVLCFHSRLEWASGGFLTIASFFTLSGYLITSLFLAEWEVSGRIRLLDFWARRFRRLMPAALLTLACMPLFGLYLATPDQAEGLPQDVLWALFYSANWHFWLTDAAYQELFSAPSPLLHFWSLSIEEQFYLAYPLLALAVLGRTAGSRRALGWTLLGLSVAGTALAIGLTASGSAIDRIYYGSDTRAPELLLGALLATWLHGRTLTDAVRRIVDASGVLAIGGMLALWATSDVASGWLYRGGLSAYTLLSMAVIAAAVQPEGWVRRALSLSWLSGVGRISYGAYLYHWPLFLALTADRTGLEGAPLLALRATATLAVAALSYQLLEAPIRRRRWLLGWRPYLATPAAFAAVATAVLLAPLGPEDRYVYRDFDPDTVITDLFAKIGEVGQELPDPDPPTLWNAQPRVAVFGDSTGFMLSLGLLTWLWKEDTGRLRPGVTQLGCGFLREGRFRQAGRELTRRNQCHDHAFWRALITNGKPDLIVVLTGPWDIADRQLPGDEQWRAPGDPLFDAYMRAELLAALDTLSAQGSLVLWLTHPHIERHNWDGTRPEPPFPVSDPARIDRLNDLIRELETLRPGKIRVVDFAGYMQTLPGGELSYRYRRDGVHLTRNASMKIANEWLGPEILRIYREEATRTSEQGSSLERSKPAVSIARYLFDRTSSSGIDRMSSHAQSSQRLPAFSVQARERRR